jgi:phage baseplate assembly protein W
MAQRQTVNTLGIDLSSLIATPTVKGTNTKSTSILNGTNNLNYNGTLYRGCSTIDFNSGTIKKGVFPATNTQGLTSPIPANYNIENPGNNTFTLTDVSLVERNILNHINTIKGSRVMMPGFGSIIPELLFEPLDDEVVIQVEDELKTIIAYDPRVQLLKIKSTKIPNTNTLNVAMMLMYIELNVTKNMDFNLEFSA